jgi:hypothetical protein
MIIREWQDFRLRDSIHMTTEEFHRVLVDLGLIDEPSAG